MKLVLFILALLISVQANPAFAREFVCNDGAMVLRENTVPRAERQYPDPDVSATIYDRGVVEYLLNTFGHSGDGGYGRLAYGFHDGILTMHFFGSFESPRTVYDPQLMTGGKFSNAWIRKEGSGARVMLKGAGHYADWYFERCKIVE